MPGLLQTAGAVGTGLAKTGEQAMSLSELISQQKHRAFIESMESQRVGLEQKRVGMEQQRTDIAERGMKIQQDKESREKEQYERGEQLLDPDDYLGGMGIRPTAAKMLKEKAATLGFGEKLPTGKMGLRQKNINPAMQEISKDLQFQLQMEEGNLGDIEKELQEAQVAAQKKPEDEKARASVEQLIQAKNQSFTKHEMISKAIQKQQTIPAIEAAKIRVVGQMGIEAGKEASAEARQEKELASREKIADANRKNALTIAQSKEKASGGKKNWKDTPMLGPNGFPVVMDTNTGKMMEVDIDTGKTTPIDVTLSHALTVAAEPKKSPVTPRPTASSVVQTQKVKSKEDLMRDITSIIAGPGK